MTFPGRKFSVSKAKASKCSPRSPAPLILKVEVEDVEIQDCPRDIEISGKFKKLGDLSPQVRATTTMSLHVCLPTISGMLGSPSVLVNDCFLASVREPGCY